MTQIQQNAGKNSTQIGIVNRDVNIDNRKVDNRKLGAWGCMALSVIAIMAGAAGVLIYLTRETGSTIRETAPLMATVAVVQATTYAPVPVPVSNPVANPVANTNPSVAVAPELSQFVSNFLGLAAELEMQAYAESNPAYVAQVMTGGPLERIQSDIAQFQMNGYVYVPVFDFAQSRSVDIRVINETTSDATIEVDNCEVWSASLYTFDGNLVEMYPAQLVPQTITIFLTETQAWITNVVFYESAVFCS